MALAQTHRIISEDTFSVYELNFHEARNNSQFNRSGVLWVARCLCDVSLVCVQKPLLAHSQWCIAYIGINTWQHSLVAGGFEQPMKYMLCYWMMRRWSRWDRQSPFAQSNITSSENPSSWGALNQDYDMAHPQEILNQFTNSLLRDTPCISWVCCLLSVVVYWNLLACTVKMMPEVTRSLIPHVVDFATFMDCHFLFTTNDDDDAVHQSTSDDASRISVVIDLCRMLTKNVPEKMLMHLGFSYFIATRFEIENPYL